MIDLPSVVNAPSELPLDGVTYRACRLAVADYGEILAWLWDRLPLPEDGSPALFSSAESWVALSATDGLAVVLHLSLLPCQPGLTRDAARRLAARMDEGAQARLFAIAFRRRAMRPRPGGKDLALVDWGPIFESLTQHQAGMYGAAARLTLDQLDNHAARGEPEGPDSLTPAEAQAMWEADRRADEADGTPPDPDAVLLPGESIASPEVPGDGG